jgi:hypothetical protein
MSLLPQYNCDRASRISIYSIISSELSSIIQIGSLKYKSPEIL